MIRRGADVQRRVARDVHGVDIRSVEEQVLDVLNKSHATRLVQFSGEVVVATINKRMILQQQLTTVRRVVDRLRVFVQHGVVQRRQAFLIVDVRRRAQFQQRLSSTRTLSRPVHGSLTTIASLR